jgi:hypothetical protein
MSWTFDPSLSLARDNVRMLVGDVLADDPQIQDETIDAILNANPDPYEAAAILAFNLAAQFTRYLTFAAEGVRYELSQRVKQYRELGMMLRAQAVMAPGGLGSLSVFGVSKSQIAGENQDPDRVPDRFRVGMFDYPGMELQAGGADSEGQVNTVDDDLTDEDNA